MSILLNKNILVAVCGGIAAYKSAELVRLLKKQGAQVKVVMTQAALAFITTTTLQALSGNEVYTDEWLNTTNAAMDHISLAKWAHLIIVAPASADTIARMAHGHANDLLTTTCLATKAPLLIAPAMNQQMWHNTFLQNNLALLQKHGVTILPPDSGEQACGDIGPGRLPDPVQLVAHIISHLNGLANPFFQKKNIIITAGPTHEALDPVRYLGNHSSGKMGYALARAASEHGAEVTLISGPTTLSPPSSVKLINVVSAEDMFTAVMTHIHSCHLFIGAAAVADYRPAIKAVDKIKKQTQPITLNLIPNPDIIAAVATLSPRPFVVGFAAETTHLFEYAKQKLISKSLDMIIANEVGNGQAFGRDENMVCVIDKNFHTIELPLMPKLALAHRLMEVIYHAYQQAKKEGSW